MQCSSIILRQVPCKVPAATRCSQLCSVFRAEGIGYKLFPARSVHKGIAQDSYPAMLAMTVYHAAQGVTEDPVMAPFAITGKLLQASLSLLFNPFLEELKNRTLVVVASADFVSKVQAAWTMLTDTHRDTTQKRQPCRARWQASYWTCRAECRRKGGSDDAWLDRIESFLASTAWCFGFLFDCMEWRRRFLFKVASLLHLFTFPVCFFPLLCVVGLFVGFGWAYCVVGVFVVCLVVFVSCFVFWLLVGWFCGSLWFFFFFFL